MHLCKFTAHARTNAIMHFNMHAGMTNDLRHKTVWVQRKYISPSLPLSFLSPPLIRDLLCCTSLSVCCRYMM